MNKGKFPAAWARYRFFGRRGNSSALCRMYTLEISCLVFSTRVTSPLVILGNHSCDLRSTAVSDYCISIPRLILDGVDFKVYVEILSALMGQKGAIFSFFVSQPSPASFEAPKKTRFIFLPLIVRRCLFHRFNVFFFLEGSQFPNSNMLFSSTVVFLSMNKCNIAICQVKPVKSLICSVRSPGITSMQIFCTLCRVRYVHQYLHYQTHFVEKP